MSTTNPTAQMTAAELHDALQRITEHLVHLRDETAAKKRALAHDELGHAFDSGVVSAYNVALDALWHHTRGEHGQATGGDGS